MKLVRGETNELLSQDICTLNFPTGFGWAVGEWGEEKGKRRDISRIRWLGSANLHEWRWSITPEGVLLVYCHLFAP